MFDSSSFEMPSTPVSEQAPMPKEDGPGVTPEHMEQLADFFEKELEVPESKIVPLMADVAENPNNDEAWELLANGLTGRPVVGDFTAGQLKKAMKGSELLKQAAEKVREGSEEEDVDLTELNKAMEQDGDKDAEDVDVGEHDLGPSTMDKAA